MNIAVVLSGSARKYSLWGDEYIPLVDQEALAKYLDADLYTSTWKVSNDTRNTLNLPKVDVELDYKDFKNVQHYAHFRTCDYFDLHKYYDIIVKARYDAPLTLESIDLIRQRVDNCIVTKRTSGITANVIHPFPEWKPDHAGLCGLNDHYIVYHSSSYKKELVDTYFSKQRDFILGEKLWWLLLESHKEEQGYKNFAIKRPIV